MFYKYQSHSLIDLARKLAELSAVQNDNPMMPSWVVVQNNEVKEWLSLQIAEQNGIAGNIRFIFPSEFIWMIYRLKRSDVPQALPSDLNALQWTLFELFGKNPELLHDIPHVEGINASKSKRFQLAEQIADVFDQYQVYRPDMVYNWKLGKPSTKHVDEHWQLNLWRKLESYWANKPETNNIPSRALAHNNVIEWLSKGDKDILAGLPEQIFVFGISHISRPFMDVIGGISGHRDIHYFNRNIKVDTGHEECNSLFESWKESYESQNKLLDIRLKESGYEPDIKEISSRTENLTNIELHSCHGVRREIEVLKDEVLRFLDKHSDANTSDVLILVPDADEYAPLLETHFSTANSSDNLNLPLSRLSKKQSQLNEHSLINLLDLLISSFKPSSVVDVISLEPIKRRFKLKDDDIDLIEEWILSNRIYRGMGDSFNDPFSWQKGVNQLIAGAVMAPDNLESFHGLVPVVELSTSDEMALAAKFSSFIYALNGVIEEIEENKTPAEWLALVKRMCKELIIDPENEDKEPSIFKTLAKLKEHIAYSEGQELVPFSLFRNWLKGQVNTSNSSSGRFGQGIIVSTYIPYRSVPFRFIAIMGLNEGVFPRRAVRPEFDLIYKDPKVGDRIQSEDDTYLFYEVLSSASDHLHISYKGQDLRSEMDRLPSMLVQQLKESLPEDRIILNRHRLHSFNKNYFTNESDNKQQKLRRSYDEKQKLIAKQVNSPVNNSFNFKIDQLKSQNIFKVTDLSINDLILFYTNPANYLMNSKLGVNFNLYNNEIEDREIFDLKGLDRYKVDALLFQSIQKEVPDSKILDYVSTAGFIPDMLKGKRVFQKEYSKTLELRQKVAELTQQEEKTHELRFKYGEIQVYGTVNGLYGKSLVLHRVGQRRERHEIEQWILHNALLADGYPITNSFYISFNKNNSIEVNRLNTQTIKKSVFKDLLIWFVTDQPNLDKVNFFPKTSKTYTEVLLKTEDENEALNKAQNVFVPDKYNKYAEGGDEATNVIWQGFNPIGLNSFKKNALNFWEPYLKALEESNE